MNTIYDEFEAMRFLYQDKESAENALQVIEEIHGKGFIGKSELSEAVQQQTKVVEIAVPVIDLDMISSRINFMLAQSTENMSAANKESLREILSEVNYAKKRQN